MHGDPVTHAPPPRPSDQTPLSFQDFGGGEGWPLWRSWALLWIIVDVVMAGWAIKQVLYGG